MRSGPRDRLGELCVPDTSGREMGFEEVQQIVGAMTADEVLAGRFPALGVGLASAAALALALVTSRRRAPIAVTDVARPKERR